MKKPLFLSLFVCISQWALCQQVSLKKPITPEGQKELMDLLVKEVFSVNVQVSYRFSYFETRPFAKISDLVPYDDAYLQKARANLKKDSLNPHLYDNLAHFYRSRQEYAEAARYFKKALAVLDMKKTTKDSAAYYSSRASYKMYLGEESAADFEKALAINPCDSVAVLVYPISLMNNGETEKVRGILSHALESIKVPREDIYHALMMNELLNDMNNILKYAEDSAMANGYIHTDFREMYHYSLLDTYAKRFAGSGPIQTLRLMGDVFALTSKLYFFSDGKSLQLNYLPSEKQRLQELEDAFSSPKTVINEYARAKNLGIINFMQDDSKTAVEWLEKSIQAFPPAKIQNMFTPVDAYSFLAFIPFSENDVKTEEAVLKRKVAANAEGTPNPDDYVLLARLALRDGRTAEATEWIDQAKELDPENATVLSFKSHLYFLKGITSMSKRYGQEAFDKAISREDQIDMLIQFAFYSLHDGNAVSTYENLQRVRAAQAGKCQICDKLESTYLIVESQK